jgi:CheY-like chemotaxis protein
MDGFEFLAELRSHAAWHDIPVVVLTAMDLGAAERRRLSGHVKQIVQKGAHDRRELLRELREILAIQTRAPRPGPTQP